MFALRLIGFEELQISLESFKSPKDFVSELSKFSRTIFFLFNLWIKLSDFNYIKAQLRLSINHISLDAKPLRIDSHLISQIFQLIQLRMRIFLLIEFRKWQFHFVPLSVWNFFFFVWNMAAAGTEFSIVRDRKTDRDTFDTTLLCMYSKNPTNTETQGLTTTHTHCTNHPFIESESGADDWIFVWYFSHRVIFFPLSYFFYSCKHLNARKIPRRIREGFGLVWLRGAICVSAICKSLE